MESLSELGFVSGPNRVFLNTLMLGPLSVELILQYCLTHSVGVSFGLWSIYCKQIMWLIWNNYSCSQMYLVTLIHGDSLQLQSLVCGIACWSVLCLIKLFLKHGTCGKLNIELFTLVAVWCLVNICHSSSLFAKMYFLQHCCFTV